MKFLLEDDDNKLKSKFYTNGVKTIKVKEGEIPPEGFYPGRTFNAKAWNKGLTKDSDERVRKNVEATRISRINNGKPAWNRGLTKETDERVAKYASKLQGEKNPMYGSHKEPWNTGLTKETDDRVLKMSTSKLGKSSWNKGLHIPGHSQSEETRDKISKAHLDPSFKEKRYNIMKNNNTLFVKDSKAESDYFNKLKLKYDENDIIRQYFDKDRYPFKCDFYIKSEDKFIEVHGNWTHGGRPFDPNDEECKKKLQVWEEKAKQFPYYKNAIYTWTDLDVRKAKIAKDNNLNFEVIYY